MSDNYGPQQGWQDQPPQDQPQNWQGQPAQGWQGQPQQGQPAQGQPQQGGWQGQPAQGQPQQWQGQQPQDQQWQQGPAGWQPGQPPAQKKKPLGVIITAVVVVLAIVAGVTVWLVSRKDTQTADGGQASPQAAASDMIQSLAGKDVVGVAQQLDPSEAQLFTDLSGDVLGELKRLEILKSDATAETLTGTTITVDGLTFDDAAAEQVNDHVTIVKLTGGTVTVKTDPSTVPLSDKIKEAAGDELAAEATTETVDIAAKVKENGEPFRIATVKRGDNWYPSLFYSVADNWFTDAAKDDKSLAAPELATAIAPIGAGSAEEAVTTMLDKAMAGDLEGAIGMLPPDEMGVLYDYGKRIIAAGGLDQGSMSGGVKISDPQFTTSDVTGGTKVSLKSITVEAEGQKIVVTVDAAAGTLSVDVNGQQQQLTADSVLEMIPGAEQLPAQGQDIVKRLFKQALTLGVVTTEVDGKFYVSPLRTYSGVLLTLLQGLQPADIDFLITLAKGSGG